MVVGVGIYELRIAHARSLKDKRMVVRSLRDQVRNLGVSCSEVALQDLHQRARLAAAVVGSDQAAVERVLRSVLEKFESCGDASLAGWHSEILPFDASIDLQIPGMKFAH
ncbi:MAG TPA: DUF503 domain-containing protein [Thermoanaerobaculia bacterium]|nr:DUF503 domain-containing protein [Thermoanaerobaculia bacterium]